MVVENAQDSPAENDGSCQGKALRNPIILENIFKYFSTSSLLSACSLVNKTWNREARIFIRNHRKCTARNPDQYSPNTCKLLQDLGDLCRHMRTYGREVPFNSLKVESRSQFKECPKDSGCDGLAHRNLPREMNLKYLEIGCSFYDDDEHNQDSS